MLRKNKQLYRNCHNFEAAFGRRATKIKDKKLGRKIVDKKALQVKKEGGQRRLSRNPIEARRVVSQ